MEDKQIKGDVAELLTGLVRDAANNLEAGDKVDIGYQTPLFAGILGTPKRVLTITLKYY